MLNRSANQAWRRLTVTAVYLIPEELGPKHPSEAFTIMSSSGMDDGTGGGVAPPSGSYVETLQAPSSGGEDSQVVGPEGSETPATIADASAASHSVDGLGTSSSEDAGTSSYDGDQNVLDEPVSATPERNQPPANMTDDELRSQLRAVFDEFDADHSGAVSIQEMSAMIAAMKLDVTDEKLAEMMRETDADGSGEIDFEEFFLVLKKQSAGGDPNGLGSIFSMKASSMFSWFQDTLTPFKGALDAMAAASPLKLFGTEERDAKERAEAEAMAAMAKERALAVKKDLSSSMEQAVMPLAKPPPRKAATPKRSDLPDYKKPSCLIGYSAESSGFESQDAAQQFFRAPRVVSAAAHVSPASRGSSPPARQPFATVSRLGSMTRAGNITPPVNMRGALGPVQV